MKTAKVMMERDMVSELYEVHQQFALILVALQDVAKTPVRLQSSYTGDGAMLDLGAFAEALRVQIKRLAVCAEEVDKAQVGAGK